MKKHFIYCNRENFTNELLNTNKSVGVFFYGNQCPPCRKFAPLFEELARKYSGQMKFIKIKAWENEEISNKYNINLTPTIIFIKNQKVIGKKLENIKSKTILKNEIEKILGIKKKNQINGEIKCDVLIIGGGPAGLTAGIFAGRSNLNTVIIDNGAIGGQILNTYDIKNYPGTVKTISGYNLVNNMIEQAKNFGVEIQEFEQIKSINLTENIKKVITTLNTYCAKTVIIATGAYPKKLPIAEEIQFRSKGIHYCALCDGELYINKDIIVVGGGDSATQEAEYLTRFATTVTIVHQYDYFEASKVNQEKIFNNPKIKIIWNSKIEKAVGGKSLISVKIRNLVNNQITNINTNGIFVYIGMNPETNFLDNQILLDNLGYIITDENMKTSIEGVFAAGDVRQKNIRQITTAVSDGSIAGIMCGKYLE